MEPMVYVMPKADPTQTAANRLAVKGAGEILEGHGAVIDGYQWLQEEYDNKEGWILIDGEAIGQTRKFLEPVAG